MAVAAVNLPFYRSRVLVPPPITTLTLSGEVRPEEKGTLSFSLGYGLAREAIR